MIIILSFIIISSSLTFSQNKGPKKVTDHTSIAQITARGDGLGITFTIPTTGQPDTYFAGTLLGTLNSQSKKFYCIDIGHHLIFNDNYWDEGNTPAEITYILNNYFPYNTSNYPGKLSDINKEAAAIQFAIWHFSDNADPSTIQSNDAVKNRANEIIADAIANSGNVIPLETLIIIPTSQSFVQGTPATFDVYALDLNGNAIPNLNITLTTTLGNLSMTSGTTDANGKLGPITLTNSGIGTATINAQAQVMIPQGTKYYNVAAPNDKQKLVLATPASDLKEVNATVTWYTKPSGCDLNGYTTFTQGGWGSPSNSAPGKIRDQYFSTVFPSGLVIGNASGNYHLTLTSASAVKDYLPDGNTAAAYTQNYTNPTSKINVLSGQLTALKLNVAFSAAGVLGSNTTKLGDLVIASGPFYGKTVSQMLALAEIAIGGGSLNGYTLSQFNDAATAVNENFDNGTVDKGYLTCNVQPCENTIGDFIWHDKNHNGIQDAGELGIPGVKVELMQGATVVATATTDVNGKYSFANLSNGGYTVRIAASNFDVGGALYSNGQTKWYASPNNSGSKNTTLACGDDLTLDFGYYKTCVSLTKTADKQSYNKGDIITYTFVVENCGDIQLHGGVDVFDAMLNPNGNHLIKHIDVLEPGASTTFTMTYQIPADYCGQITNTARAEGHPVSGSTQNCNTQGFITYTPGGWGAPAHGNNAGTLRDTYFSTVFPSGLTVGGTYTLTLSDAAAVQAFLPSGGTPAALTQNYTNPGNTLSNTLAGHIVSNTLAVKFNEAGYLGTNPTLLGNLVIASGTFAGMTVNQFLALANVALGGGTTGYSLNDFTTAATAINENFDNGTNDNGFLTCPSSGITYATVVDESSVTVTVVCVDNKADLKIEKTVDNSNPNCGDNVTFTIKATNLGPSDSHNVTVTDLLPAGLDYVSSTASQGTTYDHTTGIWTIGDLTSGSFATLAITVKVDCGQINNSGFDFGVAKDYNLFVLEDATQPSSDTQGKVAVGHNASFSNYSIGDQLPANSGDVLIVGNDLTFTSGAIYNGNVVYGHATNLPQPGVSITGGTLRKDNVIDFAAAKAYLEGLSTTLSTYTVNGTTTLQWGGLTLSGTDPYLNVFKVNGSDLSSANNFTIDVPNGSAVLVNIDGTTVSWTGGHTVNGTAINNVLYNFYQATSFTIQGIDIRGSILAPFAAVNFVSGVQNGQMICKSLTGMGQFNYQMFDGNIPFDLKITNVASVTSSSAPDPNPNNNSSSATITVGSTNGGGGNNGNGGSGNGNGNGNWQQTGSFGNGAIVYTLIYDGSTIYAGTWGGKIYKSTDAGAHWTLINSGMNASFIWSLNVSGGYLFAATEKGVFKFDGSSWTLTSLSGKDVHTLASKSGILYAGTWGFGVFMSSNNGATWTAINNGFGGFLTVQALTVNGSGDLFAGIIGGGIFKLTHGTTTWTKVSCLNVWSMGATSTGIFAGTIGDGLYRSLDGGATWTKLGSLSFTFIYSISVDVSNKIYVSSVTSGVQVSSDNGNTWSDLGLSYAGVCSVVANPNSNDVYVGTKSGSVYRSGDSNTATSVNGTETIPTEFNLDQNYPNPFNPATTIQFAVPVSGRYSLKVYNVLGQEVANLIDGEISAGIHNVNFNASSLASGMYIYRFSGSNVNISKKMILMK